MVVAAHPEAARIGTQILQRGGNAYDAAVAVQFALAVVLPAAGNIGGGGFLLYRDRNGSAGSLDFRETAPAKRHPRYVPRQSRAMWWRGLQHGRDRWPWARPARWLACLPCNKQLGKLSWPTLVQPAVALATRGFPLTTKEAGGPQ